MGLFIGMCAVFLVLAICVFFGMSHHIKHYISCPFCCNESYKSESVLKIEHYDISHVEFLLSKMEETGNADLLSGNLYKNLKLLNNRLGVTTK